MAPQGPVGVITGGTSGIGAATALEFASLGARLLLITIDAEEGRRVQEEVGACGGQAAVVELDVADHRRLEAAVQAFAERHGPVDFLVANAGIAEQSSFATGDPERWRRVIETNVLRTLYSIRAVFPLMRERGEGHILLTASISGREPYIASKWAVVGIGHSLRLEAAEVGVRVTLIEPGMVDTPLTRNSPLVAPLLEQSTPLSPEDVARAILYAYGQPPGVTVGELAIRPLRQRRL
ncbi:MAG TPA: SDR family oxidoreductase [Candidatus Dormibacteraeota bacterium]|jgi:NADP-dependent 3-hydroxy acid dehydrogenase YdfG|nr:SDR family oxidoreductase [Candidatus Dormibacteraeota bacterium]